MSLPPDPSKLTRTKQAWAQQARFLTGAEARPGSDRLPPGQHEVRDWPVLDLGVQPDIALDRWRLRVHGAVQEQLTLDWPGLQALPQTDLTSDIHCVTTWSRYGNAWRGVTTQDLMALVKPHEAARFVILESEDGYTTNLPFADFASPHALLATHWQHEPLSRAHGAPMRLVVPHLYFWKSPKWLSRIEFSPVDKPGYWEVRGYHERGDPWTEQRYS